MQVRPRTWPVADLLGGLRSGASAYAQRPSRMNVGVVNVGVRVVEIPTTHTIIPRGAA